MGVEYFGLVLSFAAGSLLESKVGQWSVVIPGGCLRSTVTITYRNNR